MKPWHWLPFCIFAIMARQKQELPHDPLLEKILLPGKTLTVVTLEMNERLEGLLDKSRRDQKEALQRKEVNEVMLRTVVKL